MKISNLVLSQFHKYSSQSFAEFVMAGLLELVRGTKSCKDRIICTKELAEDEGVVKESPDDAGIK